MAELAGSIMRDTGERMRTSMAEVWWICNSPRPEPASGTRGTILCSSGSAGDSRLLAESDSQGQAG